MGQQGLKFPTRIRIRIGLRTGEPFLPSSSKRTKKIRSAPIFVGDVHVCKEAVRCALIFASACSCPCSQRTFFFPASTCSYVHIPSSVGVCVPLMGSYFWLCSRIRLYYPLPDRTKVADISGWMIKPVGPNSSSKYWLYCENNQIRWCRVALLHCVDLCRVSRAWACPGSQLFLSVSNLSVSLEPSRTNETQSLVFANRCGCGYHRKCLSSSHTCN